MDSSCQNERQSVLSSCILVDRISELPDAVLCKILSLVPTKNAVATSVLSTRWRRLFPFWFSPICLDLNDSLFLHQQNCMHSHRKVKFARFVDTLFNKSLSYVTCLDVMKLTCYNAFHYGDEKIVSWVSAAVGLRVKELLLKVSIYDETAELLFCSLNGCTTLTRLKLGSKYNLTLPKDFTLPNLKTLILSNLVLYDFNVLIVGCPVLEELCVKNCDSEYMEMFCICIRTHVLKKLSIKNCWMESFCDLVIDTPNLETLIYDDSATCSLSVSNLRSLRMAQISLGPFYGCEDDDQKKSWLYDVTEIVTACSPTVQRLFLSVSSINSLQELKVELPEFQNLSLLELDSIWKPKGWALLARLLCKAPNLDKLIMQEDICDHGYSSFESALPIPPVCLELHLKEIKFWEFNEKEDEFKLVEYFLKHGIVLEKLALSCMPLMKSCSLNRLTTLPGHIKIDFQPRRKFIHG